MHPSVQHVVVAVLLLVGAGRPLWQVTHALDHAHLEADSAGVELHLGLGPLGERWADERSHGHAHPDAPSVLPSQRPQHASSPVALLPAVPEIPEVAPSRDPGAMRPGARASPGSTSALQPRAPPKP